MQELTESAMIQILKEPKNALVKQFQKLMIMDGINLEFEDDAPLFNCNHRDEKKSWGSSIKVYY